MEVSCCPIRMTLPNRPIEKEKILTSPLLRITLIALACICLFISFLSFSGVSGISVFKWIGGAAACGVAFLGLSLFNYAKGNNTSSAYEPLKYLKSFSQPVLSEATSFTLEELLDSQNPVDLKIRQEIEQERQLPKLEAHVVRELIGQQEILLTFSKQQKDGLLSKDALRLLLLKDEEILALKKEKIATYNDIERNILCLRVSRLQKNHDFKVSDEESLGFLLTSPVEKLRTLPPHFFLYLNPTQIEKWIDSEEPSQLFVTSVFDVSPQPFIRQKMQSLFEKLSQERLIKCLPHFSTRQFCLYMEYLKEISSSSLETISSAQLTKWFPVHLQETQTYLESFSIQQINSLLPKMEGSLLKALPKKYWAHPELALDKLSEEQTAALCALISKEEYKEWLEQLDIFQINQFVSKIPGKLLRILPEKQWMHSALDLSDLKSLQVSEMWLTGLGEKAWTRERMKTLGMSQFNAVLSKMSEDQLYLIPEAYLVNPEFGFENLSEEQIAGIFSEMNKGKKQEFLEKVNIQLINKLLPKMNGAQLRFLPEKHLKDSHLELEVLNDRQVQTMFPVEDSSLTILLFEKMGTGNVAKILTKLTSNQTMLVPWGRSPQEVRAAQEDKT